MSTNDLNKNIQNGIDVVSNSVDSSPISIAPIMDSLNSLKQSVSNFGGSLKNEWITSFFAQAYEIISGISPLSGLLAFTAISTIINIYALYRKEKVLIPLSLLSRRLKLLKGQETMHEFRRETSQQNTSKREHDECVKKHGKLMILNMLPSLTLLICTIILWTISRYVIDAKSIDSPFFWIDDMSQKDSTYLLPAVFFSILLTRMLINGGKPTRSALLCSVVAGCVSQSSSMVNIYLILMNVMNLTLNFAFRNQYIRTVIGIPATVNKDVIESQSVFIFDPAFIRFKRYVKQTDDEALKKWSDALKAPARYIPTPRIRTPEEIKELKAKKRHFTYLHKYRSNQFFAYDDDPWRLSLDPMHQRNMYKVDLKKPGYIDYDRKRDRVERGEFR